MRVLWCLLLGAAAVSGAMEQARLDALMGQLMAEAKAALVNDGRSSFFLPDISLTLIIMNKGFPAQGNFKANGGSLRDLSTLRLAGSTQRLSKDGKVQLTVPLDFGQLHAKFNQYFFQFGPTTNVGTFTTTFNKTFASAELILSGSESSCNVTVVRASMDTFGQTSTDIKTPPALVSSLDKVEEVVVGAFFRSLPVLDEFLNKALQEASTKVNLCSVLEA